jgi:hypothetical protein
MATTLKGEERGRRGRLEKTQDGHVYTETRTYVVTSNIRNESPYTVVATAGLPLVHMSILAGTNARCKSLTPEQDKKTPHVWKVVAEFSTEKIDQKENPSDPTNPDPTQWIPVYKGVIETYPEVMYFDRSGARYVNSAGDRFPEPLVKQRPIIVYEFSQYEAPSITDKQIADRVYCVNNATFKGFPAWSLLLSAKSFERGYFYGYEAVKIDYRIAYKKGYPVGGTPQGWKDVPLDVGYSYLDSSGKKLNSPYLVSLNSDGTKRADGATPDAKIFEGPDPISFSFLR